MYILSILIKSKIVSSTQINVQSLITIQCTCTSISLFHMWPSTCTVTSRGGNNFRFYLNAQYIHVFGCFVQEVKKLLQMIDLQNVNSVQSAECRGFKSHLRQLIFIFLLPASGCLSFSLSFFLSFFLSLSFHLKCHHVYLYSRYRQSLITV